MSICKKYIKIEEYNNYKKNFQVQLRQSFTFKELIIDLKQHTIPDKYSTSAISILNILCLIFIKYAIIQIEFNLYFYAVLRAIFKQRSHKGHENNLNNQNF